MNELGYHISKIAEILKKSYKLSDDDIYDFLFTFKIDKNNNLTTYNSSLTETKKL